MIKDSLAAVKSLHSEDASGGDLVLGGLNGASIGRHQDRRDTGPHHRRLWGASTQEVLLAGNWTTARMVAHYSAGATAKTGTVAKYL